MKNQNAVRLQAEAARNFCKEVFIKTGMPADDAETVADNLLFADLRGISTHGITRVNLYVQRAESGQYNTAPQLRVISQRPGLALLDGDNCFGAVAGKRAMELAMEKAAENGVGACFVQHSNHFGAASYYAMMASRNDMVGFASTNAPPNMAPTGASVGLIGTNPFSVAVPSQLNADVVLDISTSVTARGRIINAAKNNEPLPAGLAIDEHGNPTTDAQAALRGAVLPFGGHKGSGMAIMLDILCGILSGAAYGQHIMMAKQDREKAGADIGHMFLAVDISAIQPVEQFKGRIDQMIAELTSAPRAAEAANIFYPGEIEANRLIENREKGIAVSAGVFKELQALAERKNLGQELRRCVISAQM